MTPTSLKTYTLKDLAEMAKQRGVNGWHSMRKDQLVTAIVRAAKAAQTKTAKKASVPARRAPAAARTTVARSAVARKTASRSPVARVKPTTVKTKAALPSRAAASKAQQAAKSQQVVKRLKLAKAKQDQSKNLAFTSTDGEQRDRLVVMVRGPYWLHACWELSPTSVSRAQVAMGQEWHAAKPVLRVMNVSSSGTTSSSERIVRDIVIHGGVKNWYVDVAEPPQSYRLEIGYLGSGGKFFSLARSNVVSTPAPGSSELMDPHWSDVAENCDKIYAMSGGFSADHVSIELQELFEERLRRPMGSPLVTRYGIGAEALLPKQRDFEFEINAEMVVYGKTRPNSYVTLQGEPVKLREDGSFTVRMDLPNRRQVIPIVASSKDGVEQRTIVLAVERNTKVMEPVMRDNND